MRKQIRKSVFETNSSTSHTLTLKKADVRSTEGIIPSNTVFQFIVNVHVIMCKNLNLFSKFTVFFNLFNR